MASAGIQPETGKYVSNLGYVTDYCLEGIYNTGLLSNCTAIPRLACIYGTSLELEKHKFVDAP